MGKKGERKYSGDTGAKKSSITLMRGKRVPIFYYRHLDAFIA